jgi:hypothetical protein
VCAHSLRISGGYTDASIDRLRQSQICRRKPILHGICILVFGFAEQATRHIYTESARSRSARSIARYVERQREGWTNADATKLCTLTSAFDARWTNDLEDYLAGQRKDALDSVVANRHVIAHGRDVGLTYIRIRDYYREVRDIVAYLETQCA